MIKNDVSQNNERENEKDVIFGRNSVAEAIKSGRPLDSVMVARGDRSGSIPKIVADAKKAGIVIKEVDPKKLDFVCGHNNHQGIAAFGAVKEYSTIEDIFATAEERNEAPFIIICDEIEDPHNLGAIIRTAEAAGAHGVIIPKRRSASLSFTVAKTSAGAVEFMHVARVTNIPQIIDELKKQGCTKNMICAKDMADAVENADKFTEKGKSCLFSPAAASYNYYKNFEEKGKHFKKLVQQLTK